MAGITAQSRTMYRLLDAEGENRERRDQLIDPRYQKSELLVSGPNQLWSWDITSLRGAGEVKIRTPVFLYLILDPVQPLCHRLAGLSHRETVGLGQTAYRNSCEKQKIVPGQLTIRVVRTHGPSHVSDDNPFAEAHFKTMKHLLTTRAPRSSGPRRTRA